jgi:hypothetical protein
VLISALYVALENMIKALADKQTQRDAAEKKRIDVLEKEWFERERRIDLDDQRNLRYD